MFEALPEPKADAILGLMAAFRADTRTDKLDLGVGVYKDSAGKTPVMRAIKNAEKKLLETQDTKSYVAPIGSAAFCNAIIAQVFGSDADTSCIRAAQSVGGSGALRVLADLLKQGRPDADIWLSDPSWPNHVPLMQAAGYALHTYPYYDAQTGSVNIEGMLESLGKAKRGDIVLLHGCCHNPTGADLSMDDWARVVKLLKDNDLFPFIDLAYQGFGDGLEQDAAAVRYMASELPELVVAASCSKNLGLYRERVGAAILMAKTEAEATRALGRLGGVIRSNYSMPPDHGANTTEIVLSDAALNADWKEELETMRLRMVSLRQAFSEALRKRSNSERFDYIAEQKGMFSRLPLNTAQLDKLRDDHGIYIVGDGRINVAGLPESGMEQLADAICTVLAEVE
ncbi:aromatic amino acid transaminase [Granulosicoccus antarcticus]|uniref:Aminotransferase n=1 Tax=Granulosicoccus antarcticus IMCC3135 TaxID=1192854 RepID=A0A2Z2NWE9_9GAMM|nr:amino acid aminotransferase [Granulosicoccus antarcticus]ASJ74381.1 Aromatic-amino-acid aminotransferase [Granulosicoccus antarcticus IMCC3135]